MDRKETIAAAEDGALGGEVYAMAHELKETELVTCFLNSGYD